MRIIGGKLRGKKLYSPSGKEIRPTADRLKESIFNIIGTFNYTAASRTLEGGTTLDLYAGTGALGLEALSRGALKSIFVDYYPNPLRNIEKNIHSCHMQDHTVVIKWNIKKNLNCLATSGAYVTHTFIDPPYNCALVNITLSHLHHCGVLLPNALVIVEHDPQEAVDPMLEVFSLIEQRKYGKTVVSFLNYMV